MEVSKMHRSYVGVAMGTAGVARAGDEVLWPERVTWPQWRWGRGALRFVSVLHRLAYRLSGGRAAGTFRGGEVLLLTTTGRKSRRPRTWPLCFVRSGDDVVVVASAAGAERHPGWYHNLRANPLVRVQVGGQTRDMVARTVEGHDRAQLWDRLADRYPVLRRYQAMARRAFPVVVLQPATVLTGGM